jgi:UDP-glucose:(heptosyl)LPS alpha-1,3-glucosyltransferase
MVIGQDDPGTFQRIARSLAVDDRVIFMKGRSDVPRFLLGADLLIHPAYNENTGTVLLEALVAGLPVLVTDVCGYAHYISEADCGLVVPSPFKQSQLDQMLSDMLSNSALRKEWKANALRFADQADLYSLPERAADVILGAGA